MIVARYCQHAAVFGGAEGIGMPYDVHAPIDTRAFAIPHTEHTVVPGAGEEIGLLATPHRGGSEVFVYPGLEIHVVLVQPGPGLPHGLVHAPDGRPAIAGDKCRGIESPLLIALVLQHRKPDQRFDARHISPGSIQGVFVIE